MTDLLLIRHAPSQDGKVAGRRDVPAQLPEGEALAAARRSLAKIYSQSVPRVFTSPLQRCRQTALALLPGCLPADDARLCEQDFGAWEGVAAMPDLGPLTRAEIAVLRPPGGENFLDLASRVAPALQEIAAGGPAVVFAHAGTIRVGLGLALGEMAQGLTFEVAPLSATLLRALPGGVWSIGFVNHPL